MTTATDFTITPEAEVNPRWDSRFYALAQYNLVSIDAGEGLARAGKREPVYIVGMCGVMKIDAIEEAEMHKWEASHMIEAQGQSGIPINAEDELWGRPPTSPEEMEYARQRGAKWDAWRKSNVHR